MKTITDQALHDIVAKLIPEHELRPSSAAMVTELPSFASKMNDIAQHFGCHFNQLGFRIQNALILRRLQQMTNTIMLNPFWGERLAQAGIDKAPTSFEEWQALPISEKPLQAEAFMGTRPGLVVPLEMGGFEIVASGGTSAGVPVEIVYALRELHDTYKIAGEFIGDHMLSRYWQKDQPKWLATTLADYQMWSSGTMVGGVLQHAPGVNYIGAGPLMKETYQHMMSYPGEKAIMGITAGIAILAELGEGMPQADRENFRVAMYGSGVLPELKRKALKALYPNLEILSYFAATQAETIGLQLDANSEDLAAVPGLHLIEIVDENGRWVEEGEEGELVVTRLHAHEAPFIRYKVGDRMVRRPNLVSDQLNTQQFRFAGRSGDVLHLNDSQYSAPRAYRGLVEQLSRANFADLDELAHEIQLVNHRSSKTLTLMAAVDDPIALHGKLVSCLGMHGIHQVFVDALTSSLSLFNQGEANAHSINSTGYRFHIQFVVKDSPELFRTEVGKTPLLRDIIE